MRTRSRTRRWTTAHSARAHPFLIETTIGTGRRFPKRRYALYTYGMLVLAALGFCFGILALTLATPAWPVMLFALLLAGACGILYSLRKRSVHKQAGVFFLFLAIGMARTLFLLPALPDAFLPIIDTDATLQGTIVAAPDIRETSQRITMEIERDGETTRVLVVAPLFPERAFGERIEVSGYLMRPEPFSTDSGRVFRYDQFLAKDGIHLIMPRATVTALMPRAGWWEGVLGFFLDIKANGTKALTVALPEPHASLASGLILGGKQGLGAELLDDFITSGLVHIVVLSGYNVMIVAEFIMRIFGLLSPVLGSFVGASAIVLFVLSAGAGPASIRAGIMAAIALYARATGRTYDAFRALLVAGVLMLLVNPMTLVYDPGFQLSFVATLGLIFGAPLFERYLAFVKNRFFRDILASTLAAQIAVLPLLLYQNGLFSLVALPANMLVLPIVPLAMLASFTALLAGLSLPLLAPVIGLPAYALLSYIVFVASGLAAIPLGSFTIPAFPFPLVIVSYLALFALWRRLAKSAASAHPAPAN